MGGNRRATVRSSPLYLWVASMLRDQIEAGDLGAHASVPSERALSERYGVSRMTARHAVETLTREGYVYRSSPTGRSPSCWAYPNAGACTCCGV